MLWKQIHAHDHHVNPTALGLKNVDLMLVSVWQLEDCQGSRDPRP